MPGRNGTGPMGQGPLTGRGLGPCAGGYAYGGRMGKGCRSGAGFGRGLGYGMRAQNGYFGFNPQTELTAEEKKELLNERKAMLQSELENLQKNIDEL